MDRKILLIALIALLGTMVIPAVSDQSSATTSETTMSDNYLSKATVEWKDSYNTVDRYFYFNAGSENDKLMDKYLEDQKTAVPQDDKGSLHGTVHIYALNSIAISAIHLGGDGSEGIDILMENVMKPYNNSFFVKAGDTFRIKAFSVKDMNGQDAEAYVQDSNYNRTYILDNEFSEQSKKSKEYSISFYDRYVGIDSLFYTVSYEVSGNSEPNGSATTFMAVCAIITIAALGILVLSSLRPKWSR